MRQIFRVTRGKKQRITEVLRLKTPGVKVSFSGAKSVGDLYTSPERPWRPWRKLRVPRGHPALPTGPADGLGHLRSVAGRGSTCSQLAITSVHVVSTLRTAFRVGALRPPWTLSDAP